MQKLFLLLAFIFSVTVADRYKVVCYFGSWSVFRPGAGKFVVEDINPHLCTHLIYAFIDVYPNATIKIMDYQNDITNDGYNRFNGLKCINRDLKTLIALGGGSADSSVYSNIVKDPSLRLILVENLYAFIKKHKFDGLDLDWEYPAQNGGAPEDKANFVLLIRELRARFAYRKYLLSAAVGTDFLFTDTSYDVPQLSRYLDFINVMTYDFHGAWDSTTGIHNGLYRADHNPNLNAEDTINHWISKGACPSKLILGIPLYGRTFKLASAANNQIGAPAVGGGNPGPYTASPGSLSYTEVCLVIKTGYTVKWETQTFVPYAFKQDQWITYEVPISARKKAQYVKYRGLGGAMVWSIDQDDFRDECGDGKFPLMYVIAKTLIY